MWLIRSGWFGSSHLRNARPSGPGVRDLGPSSFCNGGFKHVRPDARCSFCLVLYHVELLYPVGMCFSAALLSHGAKDRKS